MIHIKIENKSYPIPSTWYDLKFRHQLALIEKPLSNIELLSLFTGLDIEKLRDAQIKGLELAIAAWSFLQKPMVYDSKITKCGKYELPLNSKGEFNIQFESLAQFEDMNAIMFKVPDKNSYEHTKAYTMYCAIYLQKLRDGVYSLDKAEGMRDEVLDMPAHEVITLGGFFFVKLLTLLHGTTNGFQSTKPMSKKKKPVSRNSQKRLGHTGRSSTRRGK